MINLLKYTDGSWDDAKGYLHEDLDHLQIAINHLWDKAFGPDFKLKNDVIDGSSGVLRPGTGDNVVTGDVELADIEDVSASTLLGRGSTSGDGPPEELTTIAPITISGLTVIHNTSGVTPGTYGGATSIPVLTINSTGHVTAASVAGISGSVSIGANVALHTLCGGI